MNNSASLMRFGMCRATAPPGGGGDKRCETRGKVMSEALQVYLSDFVAVGDTMSSMSRWY